MKMKPFGHKAIDERMEQAEDAANRHIETFTRLSDRQRDFDQYMIIVASTEEHTPSSLRDQVLITEKGRDMIDLIRIAEKDNIRTYYNVTLAIAALKAQIAITIGPDHIIVPREEV